MACGYGGDMPDDKIYEILDSMDFTNGNQVTCPEIAQMLPMLDMMVELEM